MLTSILEPGHFMVGTKIFKGGDAIELTDAEQKELNEIVDIFVEWNDLRSEVLNTCHLTEEAFVLELATKAHDMKIMNFHLRYRLNILIAEVEKRIGGLLPLYFSSGKKKLFVNAKPEESLVYTVKFVGDTVGMPAYDFPRAIASHVVGKKNVYFDNAQDEGVAAISAFGNVADADKETWGAMAPKDMLQVLNRGLEAALVDGGPQAMSLMVLWGADAIRIINADAIPSTVDPNTRVLWNLPKFLKDGRYHSMSLAIEKAEPQQITFAVSHITKGVSPIGAALTHVLGPTPTTDINEDATPSFAITRMTPEAINDLLN